MRNIRVCLVFPRIRHISGDPPIGLAYIASYLERETGSVVSIIDATFLSSLAKTKKEILEKKPDIVGIYSDSLMAKDARALARWSRDKKIYTIIGGPQATIAPEEFIEHTDVVVRGEGELALVKIVKNYGSQDLSSVPGLWWKKNGQILKNATDKNLMELDSIPFPKRELLNMKRYIHLWNYLDSIDIKKTGTTMVVSRGCHFSCTYCQPTLKELFGKKVRYRSPENVVAEIKYLKAAYSIEGLFFHDDTFTVNKKWVIEFCNQLQKEDMNIIWGCNSRVDTVDESLLKEMHEAGLRTVHLGIESGSLRILKDIYNKKLDPEKVKYTVETARKIGIRPMGFFMIGAPTETKKEIKNTIVFAKRLKLEEASFSLTTPLKGTYLYNMVKRSCKWELDHKTNTSNYYNTYVLTGGIKSKDMKYLHMRALIEFYTHPLRLRYILRHICSLKGIKKLIGKIRRNL